MEFRLVTRVPHSTGSKALIFVEKHLGFDFRVIKDFMIQGGDFVNVSLIIYEF